MGLRLSGSRLSEGSHGLLSDPTPNGIVSRRLLFPILNMVADHTDLDDAEKIKLLPILLMVCNKLGAVWYHKGNYATAEDRYIEAARSNPFPEGDAVTTYAAQDLFYELDAFLIQTKSCLDHLVKVPACFVGKSWNLTTFGAYGADVENMVRNSIPERFKKRAAGYLRLLEKQRPWLEDTISGRDRINHLLRGGVEPRVFSVYGLAKSDGEVVVSVPLWRPTLTIRRFMDASWSKIFYFCESFLGISAVLRLHAGKDAVHLAEPLDNLDGGWFVDTSERIRQHVTPVPEPAASRLEPKPHPRRPGRKEPCHCGSGKRYGQCCLSKDQKDLRRRHGAP